MLITAIEPRRKSLSALFIDGELAVNIDTETMLKSGYKMGQGITDEQLHDLIQSSESRRASEKALYLLEHRSHSQKELADKIGRVTTREAAEAAAQHMADIGLINDEKFAHDLAENLLVLKGFSASRTMQELRKKGIEKELAQRIVEETEPDPVQKIAELIQKKYSRTLDDEKGRRRSIAALQRLGFRWDDIRTALNQIKNEDE